MREQDSSPKCWKLRCDLISKQIWHHGETCPYTRRIAKEYVVLPFFLFMGSHLPPFIILKLSAITTSTYGSNEASAFWQETNAQKSGKGWQSSQWEMEIEKSLKLLMDPVQFTISFGSRSMELSLVITKLLMMVTLTTEDKTFRPFTSQTLHTHTRLLKQGLRTRCGVRQNFANSCESDPTEWLRWRQLHKKHVMVVSPQKKLFATFHQNRQHRVA